MNTKYLKSLLLISLFPLLLLAQDLDKSFLESLPEEVAKDLLDKNLKKSNDEKPQYRRPSTFIEKPEQVSDRFGAKILSMMQSTMMPINEPNFDGSYILDFGDELELQLIGQKSLISRLSIKRDGSINVPDVGKIFLSGLSLEKAADLIKTKINISYIGVEAFITLANVRDVQIIIAGNTFNPGSYTLNGNSNVFHALSVAGGPSNLGSYRSIDLIRNENVIESIDLYETFIFGKSSFKKRLRSGDLVFIKPYANIITVSGAVKRPGKYELKSNESLSQALLFANGINNKADLQNINLERINNGKIEIKKIEGLSSLMALKALDNDQLFIREYSFRNVDIKGSVKNPGSYLMQEGDGIFELVQKAGGYSTNAYPFAGILENKKTKEINEMAAEKLYNIILSNMASQLANTTGSEVSNILPLLAELKNSDISGRVSAEFDIDKLSKDPSEDILLQDGDSVIIPELLDHVYVYGEISSEGTSRFRYGEDVKYYLNKKGGLTDFASADSVFVLHPNGETFRYNSVKNIFMNNRESLQLYPGSIIFIPRKSNDEYMKTQKIQVYTSILGNLGVSLASLAVLKD